MHYWPVVVIVTRHSSDNNSISSELVSLKRGREREKREWGREIKQISCSLTFAFRGVFTCVHARPCINLAIFSYTYKVGVSSKLPNIFSVDIIKVLSQGWLIETDSVFATTIKSRKLRMLWESGLFKCSLTSSFLRQLP